MYKVEQIKDMYVIKQDGVIVFATTNKNRFIDYKMARGIK